MTMTVEQMLENIGATLIWTDELTELKNKLVRLEQIELELRENNAAAQD
jgi:hypothetical protein